MAHINTVLSQVLKLVPRHEFDQLALIHHTGRKLRKMTRWSQFVALLSAQLTGRHSLRDIVNNLAAQGLRLYHSGCGDVTRSSLSRVNETKSYRLYEALFEKLYKRCADVSPTHRFRFHNKLYSLDSSLIDLALSIFPWADFNRTKAAVKLHLGLDHDGHIPAFATITESQCGDIDVGRLLNFPRGSIVVFDRGYHDHAWYNTLDLQGIFFVTRLPKNVRYTVQHRRPVNKQQSITCDQTVQFTGTKAQQVGLRPLRRVGYRDPETGKYYVFLTNHFQLSAKTIADIYQQRWQIELFFKWIKQNLKIKSFVGTSKNAVLTQIWIALCGSLLLAYLKYVSRSSYTLQQVLRLLEVNLFIRRDLFALLRGDPDEPPVVNDRQMILI